MEGIKSIDSVSGFSWADEVEKQEEEEEEAKAQLNQQQKPNPFGSARPREIVLQEKGVDWRKLVQKLHESSNISYVYRKEKENIATPTELTYRTPHKPFPPRNNVFERNIGNPRTACDRNGVPLVSQTLQNQIGALVPPLKYPPKNTMGLMNDQAQYRSYNTYGSEFLRSNFCDFNTNNSIREIGRRHFTGWELMHHQSAHKERDLLHNMQSNERGTLYHERLVVPPSFVNEREGNSRDDHFGRRNSVMERLGPFPIEASTPNNGGGSLNKLHRGGMKSSTTVKEERKMETEYGNQQFHADEFMGHSVGAMVDDAGRGRYPHIVDVEMVEYGGNCRKRAMISGFKNNQNQQRRRR